jgi:hypothetical protein
MNWPKALAVCLLYSPKHFVVIYYSVVYSQEKFFTFYVTVNLWKYAFNYKGAPIHAGIILL